MATTYSVKSGDTLGAIAKANNTTVDALAKANNITNPNLIKVGQTLTIGSSTPPAPITSFDIQDYRTKLASLTSPSLTTANSTPSYIPPPPAPPKVEPTIGMPKTPVTTPPVTTTPVTTPTKPVVTTPVPPTAPVVTPPTTGTGQYSVVSGDTLSRIAAKNGMSLQQLMALNPGITNPNMIQVGQRINLGGATPQATPGATPVTTPTTVQTPDQIREQNNADLAKKAGEAGLSIQEYMTLMQSQNSVSKEETDAIAKELGITALEGDVFKKPSQSSQQVYDTAYKTSGLGDIKKKIEAINTSIERDRANLTEATGKIDENPFLTETSRVGRGRTVLAQAEATINNKLAQAKTLQDLYDGGVKEIEALVTRNTNDFTTDQTVNQAKLNYLLKKAEVEATQKVSARTTGSTNSYLEARAGAKTPDLVGTSETGYFKYDSGTKKFVQVIAPAPKKATTTDTSPGAFKPTADQKAIVGRFLSTSEGQALGLTPDEMTEAMNDSVSFYALLQKASDNGIY